MNGTQARLLARTNDPMTSHEAAALVHQFAKTHHLRILGALAVFSDGLTAHEIADETGIPAHAIGKRMHEMEAAGMVYVKTHRDSLGIAIPVTRKTPSGRNARVWIARKKNE